MALELEKELKFFEEHRAEWLQYHAGKFALIKDCELVGVFDSDEAAYQAGVERWGNIPFLIKQILPHDRIEQIPALMYGLVNADLSSTI